MVLEEILDFQDTSKQVIYAFIMGIILSEHGSYHYHYHVVWIPKYHIKVLDVELKEFVKRLLFDIQGYQKGLE